MTMQKISAVAYYRVSTERQGKTGLGLEAQQAAVKAFAFSNGFTITAEFIEIESGAKNKRPQLLQAFAACKKQKAMLLIAKLDRLGRNMAFISALMEARVDFKAVDNPYANKLVLHIMAAFAEHERDMISQRTKAALQAAKRRGVELGSYGRHILSQQNKNNARLFAAGLKPIIEQVREKGFLTVRAIAEELNRMHIPTYRNSDKWHPGTVHNILKQLNQI